MKNTDYLYGASVHGIQEFIFQTNKLKDIVGASELVDKICTKEFRHFVGEDRSILTAAGNIKHIFKCKEDCENVVRNFPKKVMELAPEITMSQAVVKMEGVLSEFSQAVKELDKRLRTQRNKSFPSTTTGLIGIKRSQSTGLPAVALVDDNELIDLSTQMKRKIIKSQKDSAPDLCEKNFGDDVNPEYLTTDLDKITLNNDWIAIIHIDGNGLGKVVQEIGGNKNIFSDFSKKLDAAAKAAALAAYNNVKGKFANEKLIPMRPVVLSGDDHTLVCRGDLAIDYVEAFLSAFEKQTQDELKGITKTKYLTACAGIAFVKSSFPFYYGYSLSEALCKAAKEDAKKECNLIDGLPQSCLMFHKVQDSFTETYEEIVTRELTPCDDISFKFGPYYLNEMNNMWTIKDLKKNALDGLSGEEGNAIKSHLRKWLSLLCDNKAMAEQRIKRLEQLNEPNIKFIKEVTNILNSKRVPVYDMLTLNTIYNQNTKKKE